MTNRKIFAATILAAAGVASGAWAAEPAASRAAPATTSAATSASAPKTCTGVWDFIETDCQLTWYGITLYGVIDAGFTYQTHGAPFDPRSPPGSEYLVQRYSRSSARWDLAPNGLQIHSSASKEPSRSPETPLWSLLWTRASILIH